MQQQHRGQTFAHVRVVVRAELSARTKTEEKYISGRLHKALEKRVNKKKVNYAHHYDTKYTGMSINNV